MTDASRPFLDHELAARVSRLELEARRIAGGLISGRHASPFFGHGVEFAQHRPYAAGDDLRHVDWKIWGRSDRYTIKQFEEETNLRAMLLVDQSQSMSYGEGRENKFEMASVLAAALAYLLLLQSDSVGLATFDDDLRHEVAVRNKRNHLEAILRGLAKISPNRKTDLQRPLARVLERESKRGMVILASDLLAETDSVQRALSLLGRGGRDAIVLHVLHDDELDFPFQGMTLFEGLESPVAIPCDPKALRDSYLSALHRFLVEIRRTCANAGVQYRLVRTSEPPAAVLASLLSDRARA